jgi:hypothetical protein
MAIIRQAVRCAACGSEIAGDVTVIGDKTYHPSDLGCIRALKTRAEAAEAEIAQLRAKIEAAGPGCLSALNARDAMMDVLVLVFAALDVPVNASVDEALAEIEALRAQLVWHTEPPPAPGYYQAFCAVWFDGEGWGYDGAASQSAIPLEDTDAVTAAMQTAAGVLA